MVEIEVTSEKLSMTVKGLDKVWALKSKIEVPLEHVSDVESYRSYETHNEYAGQVSWRVPGTYVPGVIKAGSYYQGAWAFWDVHNRDKAIVITLVEEHYKLLIVEVDNPDLEIAKIKGVPHTAL